MGPGHACPGLFPLYVLAEYSSALTVVWRSENNLQESVFPFCLWVLGHPFKILG